MHKKRYHYEFWLIINAAIEMDLRQVGLVCLMNVPLLHKDEMNPKLKHGRENKNVLSTLINTPAYNLPLCIAYPLVSTVNIGALLGKFLKRWTALSGHHAPCKNIVNRSLRHTSPHKVGQNRPQWDVRKGRSNLLRLDAHARREAARQIVPMVRTIGSSGTEGKQSWNNCRRYTLSLILMLLDNNRCWRFIRRSICWKRC